MPRTKPWPPPTVTRGGGPQGRASGGRRRRPRRDRRRRPVRRGGAGTRPRRPRGRRRCPDPRRAVDPEPHARARRLTDAATAAWLGGRPGQAHSALAAAHEHAKDPALLTELAQLRGRFALNSGDAADALRIFLDAADRAPGRLALLADAAEAAACVGDTEAGALIGRRVDVLPAARREEPASRPEQPATRPEQPASVTEQPDDAADVLPDVRPEDPASRPEQPGSATEHPDARSEHPGDAFLRAVLAGCGALEAGTATAECPCSGEPWRRSRTPRTTRPPCCGPLPPPACSARATPPPGTGHGPVPSPGCPRWPVRCRWSWRTRPPLSG
ncbi:hypothetical protein ACFQ60_41330 [Streptomyces zhihengii]